MVLHINCFHENSPGEKWQALFNKAWPFYAQWFLSEGAGARKGYLTSVSMLQHHMPELMPVYNTLTTLAGGGDLEARFLSMYCPPPYMAGCSQMACHRNNIFLIRNYDYSPALFEANMLYTTWLKPVIGMSDCAWGLLDGMNADGLAASLAFGGRKISGEGFGIPLVIRYLLETASTVAEALEKLNRIPVHMAYNVTLADASGNHATVFVSPDRAPIITELPIATNHQGVIDWPEYAKLTATVERKEMMERMYSNLFENEAFITNKFLEPPLFSTNYKKNFGTLYTVKYHVSEKKMLLYWHNNPTIEKSFDFFTDEILSVRLPDSTEEILAMNAM
jgi:predicted choloylglycine hydrolase